MAVFSAIAAVAAVAGIGMSIMGSRKADKAAKAAARESARLTKEANDVTSATNSIARSRENRQQQRELRIRRAQIIQGAENAGVGMSSGVDGATGSATSVVAGNMSDTSSNLAAANAQGGIANQMSQNNLNYTNAMSSANSLSTFGSGLTTLGTAIGSNADSLGDFFGVGKGNPVGYQEYNEEFGPPNPFAK